jgi:hypothetical protein
VDVFATPAQSKGTSQLLAFAMCIHHVAGASHKFELLYPVDLNNRNEDTLAIEESLRDPKPHPGSCTL